MRKAVKHFVAFATLSLLALFTAPQVEAQQAPDPPDKEELVTFTKTYIDVMDVRAEMEVEVAQATSQEEAQRIQEEANEKMTAIIHDHDLTPERYGEITAALNADEELLQEFQEIYTELLEERGTSPL
ncbi:MAG: DUF4168 domain-containing protein [Gemmatimonadota bacterium]